MRRLPSMLGMDELKTWFMASIRSKHNNLLNYFLYDEKLLSKAYVRKCKKFLNDLKQKQKNARIQTS